MFLALSIVFCNFPDICLGFNTRPTLWSLTINVAEFKNEVYRRLARHSPRAEANYAIQYNTVPCNTIYKVMKYTKYHL